MCLPVKSASSRCSRSRFFKGSPLRFHPFAFQVTMAASRIRLARALTVVVLAAVALSAFLRPRERRVAALPPLPTGREHATREGFVAVDADALLARVRRSHAKGVVVNAWAS